MVGSVWFVRERDGTFGIVPQIALHSRYSRSGGKPDPELGMTVSFLPETIPVGTFALYDARAETYTGHSRYRAETRIAPASTFKVLWNVLLRLSNRGADRHPISRRHPYTRAQEQFIYHNYHLPGCSLSKLSW